MEKQLAFNRLGRSRGRRMQAYVFHALKSGQKGCMVLMID